MTPSPDRAFARVVLAALAGLGVLVVVSLGLLTLGAGPAGFGARTLRCLAAPVSSLDTAIHSVTVVAVVVGAGVLLAGARVVSRERAAMVELHRLVRVARLSRVPTKAVPAASAAGVGDLVDVVEADRPFGFAYGWLRPRICVSTGLVEILTAEELQAVLRHESWHVAQRDPARFLVVRTVAAAFGFVPPIRRLGHHYVVAAEIAADHHAVRAMGHSRWLASALVKVMAPPRGAAVFAGHVDARVAALAGEPPPTTAWRGRTAALILVLEVVALAPLLTGGTVPLLARSWLHCG